MGTRDKERAAIYVLEKTGNPGAAFYMRQALQQRAELLEALKEILHEYEGGSYCTDQELINKANSAITKAEATE